MIHLWSFNIKLLSESKARSIITSEEYNRAKLFRRREDQLRSMFGRAGIRLALSEYYRTDPSSFSLSLEVNRPPQLLVSCAPYLSLSHAGNQILIGLSDKPIGVDIEPIIFYKELPDMEELVFHPAEKELSKSILDFQSRLDYFFWCWTAKEAYLKGLGIGLMRKLPCIRLSTNSGAILDPITTSSWYVDRLNVEHGYMAAFASTYKKPSLHMHNLSEKCR